jgi:hypothetical protein
VKLCRCPAAVMRVAAVVLLISGASGCSNGESSSPGTAVSSAMPVSPPAVSGEDNTVTVNFWLADSFDVLANGRCAGRSTNQGKRDGARALLRGLSTGFDVESKAVAFYVQQPPRMYRGKPLLNDDYRYCHVQVSFDQPLPDPEGYSIKFAEARHEESLGRPGRTPFGEPDRPGYGSFYITVQTCRSPLDSPEKDCPEWGN